MEINSYYGGEIMGESSILQISCDCNNNSRKNVLNICFCARHCTRHFVHMTSNFYSNLYQCFSSFSEH